MSLFPYLVAAFVFLVGLYGVVSSTHLVHLVVSLSVAQSSTYVLLLAIGFKRGATAPVFSDLPVGKPAVDPVVQALALTDIVVGVTVSALLLALSIQAQKRSGTADPNALRSMHG